MIYQYNLSIIIPTKNRQFYCEEAIKQILNCTDQSIQIVIQDNSDDKNVLLSFVNELKCDRIKYNYEGEEISFVENFSRAVLLADGKYVCMLGDDDGVLPNIMDTIKYVVENDIDCYVPGQNAVYIWPSPKPIVKNAENGYLCLSYVKNNRHYINPLDSLKRLLKHGFLDYLNIETPKLYHGIVKKTVLDTIYSKFGYYFGGLTPDMYMVVALCFCCNSVVVDNIPITISGICPQSGSSASATGEHTGKLSDAPHFKGHKSYEWDKLVPPIYSVETIWAETGLKAIRDFNKEEFILYFNYDVLLSRLCIQYPQFKLELINHVKEHKRNYRRIVLYGYFSKIFLLTKKVIRRLFRKKSDVKKMFNIKNICEAENEIVNYINSIK